MMSTQARHARPAIAVLAGLVAATLLAGCVAQKQPLYRWGDYEPLIYQQYAKPGKAEPGIQVDKLNADIERTQAEGKRVPPGEHAQLGFMEYQIGNVDAAATQFELERQLFPESTVFMNTILQRLKTGGTK